MAPVLTLLLAAGSLRPQGEQRPEYEIKAGFIFYFANGFIDWPAAAFPNPQAPFTIGILGQDPFGNNIGKIAGKLVQGRKIAIRRSNKVEDLKNCAVVFIPSSEERNLKAILQELKGTNALTVGDTTGFADAGVAVNFYPHGPKIRFEINNAAAKEAGIKIRSELLGLAKPEKDKDKK